MTFKVLFIPLLLLVDGCSKMNMSDTMQPGRKVRFSAYPWKPNRSVEVREINSFLVSSYIIGAVAVDPMMQHLAVTKADNSWGYVGDYYWPIDGRTVNFYAASPAIAPASWVHAKYVENDGHSAAGFTYQTTGDASQVDLLVSNETAKNQSSTVVMMNFYHALSQIRFAARSADTDSEITMKVMSLKLLNVSRQGSFVFGASGSHGVWMASRDAADMTAYTYHLDNDIEVGNSLDHNVGASWSEDKKSGGSLMVIPQDATLVELEVAYEVWQYGSPLTDQPIVKRVTLAETWLANKLYTYRLSLPSSLSTIKFDVSVGSWDIGTTTPPGWE